MTDIPVNPSEGHNGSLTSLSLLERARSSDQQAWERLWSVYSPRVEDWCRRAKVQPNDIDDVKQDVFRAVLSGIKDFRKDDAKATFRGWLRTITKHKIVDHWRRNPNGFQAAGGSSAHMQLAEIADPELDSVIDSTDMEDRGMVYRRCLELIATDFEEASWRAFWRVVINSEAPADVAKDLNISRNAVYLAKARVLARLRSEFAGLI